MKVDKVSKDDIDHELAISTEGGPILVIGIPDRKKLRTVYSDGKKEGRGVLLGSVLPEGLGYTLLSPDIEIGWRLGIKFPDRPISKRVLVSTFVTAIIVMAKEKVAVK